MGRHHALHRTVREVQVSTLADDGASLGNILSALEADLALTDKPPEDILALARRTAEVRNPTGDVGPRRCAGR